MTRHSFGKIFKPSGLERGLYINLYLIDIQSWEKTCDILYIGIHYIVFGAKDNATFLLLGNIFI